MKELTQNTKQSNSTSNANSQSNHSQSLQQNTVNQSVNNVLLMSIRNLEKDLEVLKKLYDEELKQMRFEIEELSILKNKYSLDNFNLELKLKDFVIK